MSMGDGIMLFGMVVSLLIEEIVVVFADAMA